MWGMEWRAFQSYNPNAISYSQDIHGASACTRKTEEGSQIKVKGLMKSEKALLQCRRLVVVLEGMKSDLAPFLHCV